MFDPTKIADALKQAQGMQSQFDETLRQKTVVGQSGAGMVKITLNGKFEVTDIELDPALLAKQDKDFIESLLKSAMNDATRQLQANVMAQAQSMMQNLNIFGDQS
jgi:nucleoid-associated protein EbfC